MESKNSHLLLLLALSAVLFFVSTWAYDLWPADEPRFGQVAREMMSSGDYLVPHINGQPYNEKPPLLFWLIAAVSAPFGDVTEFSARAPSGLAALVTVLLTSLLAARLYGARVGLWSGLILATTSFFWVEARWVRTDMLLTAWMTASLYVFWRWHETRRPLFLFAFYLLIAGGLLTKGPPALVFPALLIASFYWKQRADRRRLHWLVGFVAACAVVLAWFIPARMAISGGGAVDNQIGSEALRQIVGRLFLGVSHMQPPWYYAINLPVFLLPWALFLPWSLTWAWKRRREDDKMRLLLAWIVPAFIFFSLALGKRGTYVLPLFPALAILEARAVLDLMDSPRAVWRRRTAYAWAGLLIALGLAPAVLLFTEYGDAVKPAMLAFSGCAVISGVWVIARARKTGGASLHTQMAGQFAVLAVLAAATIMPAMNAYQGASTICAPLARLSESGIDYRLYTLGFSREEYIFYSRHFHTPVLTDIIPVKTPHEIDLVDMAKQQRTLRKNVAKAVAAVPVADLESPAPAEIDTLRSAVHEAVAKSDVNPELAGAFEQALGKTVTDFAHEFEHPDPAFMFIMQEDLKWLLPLYPQFAAYTVVDQRPVGRRNMMLLANTTGAALL
ncbi:MAG: glycosyltransferase family 39 protein [Candidatus Hydrogenedentes bacterium]|nr:glycosyltransferase family 39 protein [Candidatus Hydrogenedentota bacterium]